MNTSKRIVVDFDDTLATTLNRDWDNATPNIPLISKLNSLVNDGWTVDVYTARGSISCSTREEADKKYRNQIETWLKKHGVNYTSLSFDKPLASFYIDDKAHTPESFLNIDIQNLSGLSGASIYSDGEMVHKTAKDAEMVVNWFNVANEHGITTPTIRRVIGDTISMDYIKHDVDFIKTRPEVAMGLIRESLDMFAKVKVNSNRYSWDDYVSRINGHIALMDDQVLLSRCIEFIKDFNHSYNELEYEFGHGDFGVTNLLFTPNNELYLIDPITNCFTNPVLDLAKLLASMQINDYDRGLYKKITNNCVGYLGMFNYEDIAGYVTCELIRVYKYHHDKPKMHNLIMNSINESMDDWSMEYV